jgi:hypothetical protein
MSRIVWLLLALYFLWRRSYLRASGAEAERLEDLWLYLGALAAVSAAVMVITALGRVRKGDAP